LKERRKKIKEKKAIAMAAARAKEPMKWAETDAMTGHSSDEATQTSKRLKLERSRHRNSLQAEPRRIVTKAATKTVVPAKSKSKRKIRGTPT
jgi:hypothetical protein